jgi:hypothetical protein
MVNKLDFGLLRVLDTGSDFPRRAPTKFQPYQS